MKITDFNNEHDKIMEAGKILGLSLHSKSIGQLEWNIGEVLWSKGEDFKKRALDVHFRKAYAELSSFKEIDELLTLMEKYCGQYI